MNEHAPHIATTVAKREIVRGRTLFIACVAVTLLVSTDAIASMSFTATSTQLNIYITPNLPGLAGGRSWTALVGPARSRDKKLIAGASGYAFGGMACQATIFGCKSVSWTTIEAGWATYFGASSMTTPRLDTADWQPGDQVCEATAHVQAFIENWVPPPENVTLTGYCFALPDPRPTPPKPMCSVAALPALAHGSLNTVDINGNVSFVNFGVSCNITTTVTVRAIASTTGAPTSTVPVRTDGSVTTRLMIDNVDGAQGVSFVVNAPGGWPNPAHKLTSTLTSAEPAAGALQGSGVLVVDVP